MDKMKFGAVLLVSACLVPLSGALNGSEIALHLESILSLRSGIFLPTDKNWLNETTQRYQAWNAPTYVVSIKPASKEDVQDVVHSPLIGTSSDTR